MIEVPGIARGAVQLRLRERQGAGFRHVGFAERNETGRLEGDYQRSIEERRYRWREARAAPVRPALLESEDVLEKHRYAGERTREVRIRHHARLIIGLKDHGVELRIMPLDAIFYVFDHVTRPDAVAWSVKSGRHLILPDHGEK
jgi:hypothetical protein